MWVFDAHYLIMQQGDARKKSDDSNICQEIRLIKSIHTLPLSFSVHISQLKDRFKHQHISYLASFTMYEIACQMCINYPI